MALNLPEIGQIAIRNLKNAGELVRHIWRMHFGPPQDIETELYDEYGNLQRVKIPNVAKWRDVIWKDAQSAMAKTFYVDQINGSDVTGDGSANNPFASIEKARDSAPPNGFLLCVIQGDYIVDRDIDTAGRNIHIRLEGSIRFRPITVTVNQTQYAYIPGFIITNSELSIYIDSDLNGKIIIEPNNTGLTTFIPTGRSAFKARSRGRKSVLKIDIYTREDNYNPIEIHSGFLFSFHQWNYHRHAADVNIAGHAYSGANRHILIASAALGFIQADLAPISLYVNYDGGFKNELGNVVDVREKIAGIIKDANGTPRNVVSNLIL